MKNNKFHFGAFLNYLRTQVKPLGCAENVSPFLSQKVIFEIECIVFEMLKDGQVDYWDEIFKRNKQLFLIDKLILQASKKLSVLWRFRYVLIFMLRSVYNIFDILRILFSKSPKYYLAINISGPENSQKKIIVYTNNRSRSRIFNLDNLFHQLDILVTKSNIDGYDIIESIRLNFKIKISCLKLKLRFPYINSDIIFQSIASETLFASGFKKLSYLRDNAGVFSREGITSQAKLFLYTAGKAGFLRNVLHNLPAITPNVLFPRECDNLVLISDALPYYVNEATNIIVIGDNPYIEWREIAMNSPVNNVIGILLGDDMNRWAEQEIIDREILDKLKLLKCSLCIGRPHPQELTRPHRVRYYKDLVEEYPFLELDLGESEKFLSEISLLIVYTKSTMVQEALLCNRHVIEYRGKSDFSPNKSVLDLSNNLGASSADILSLGLEIDERLLQSDSQRRSMWRGLLRNLKFNPAVRINFSEIFEQYLINPVLQSKKNSD